MNSKSVVLFGLLAALLLIFFCIFFNAERYYKELGLGVEHKSSLSSEVSISEKSKNKNYIEELATDHDSIEDDSSNGDDRQDAVASEEKELMSSFTYAINNKKTFISGKMPLLDDGDTFKKIIVDCSKDQLCENRVTFFDYNENVFWKDFVSSIVTIFKEEEIKNPKLSVSKRNIKIEGEFDNQNGKDRLLTLSEEYTSTLFIFDMTTVKHKVKEALPTVSIEQEQDKISELLKNSKITFKRNSGEIRAEGQKVLDQVAALLQGQDNVLIEIQGHTDAGGKDKVNLSLSQVRADGVKAYLVQKGINANNITAIGYGESRLLLPQTPYDPSNRRVEIYLKRR